MPLHLPTTSHGLPPNITYTTIIWVTCMADATAVQVSAYMLTMTPAKQVLSTSHYCRDCTYVARGHKHVHKTKKIHWS